MNPYLISLFACGLLAAAMVVAARVGHRVARRKFLANPQIEISSGTVDAAILSLLGLLIAFTFSNAYSRYNIRRELIVQEVNAIGTAYLRLDLLPSDAQPGLREKLREYTRSRYDIFELFSNHSAAMAEYAHSEQLQLEIWNASVAATQHETGGDGRKLLLPALNEMIDITPTRLIAIQAHPPLLVFLLLGLLSLAASWNIGYGMAKSAAPSYTHVVGFAVMASLALAVILDIEYLRYGFVTLESAHEMLRELQTKLR